MTVTKRRMPLDWTPGGERGVGLLVSVRSADEAMAALAGGADVIDVKEPHNGPLGAAEPGVVQDVVRAVAGRRPVTAAAGELAEGNPENFAPMSAVEGLAALKFGLAGAPGGAWPGQLESLSQPPQGPTIVPVVYADHQTAGAPPPEEVLSATAERGWPWLVLDTWEKRSGDLLDRLGPDPTRRLAERAARLGVRLVLAGSLRGGAIGAAARLRPALVGVRGAACDGGRGGTVRTDRVALAKRHLHTGAARTTIASEAKSPETA